jgi:hypothetical protein
MHNRSIPEARNVPAKEEQVGQALLHHRRTIMSITCRLQESSGDPPTLEGGVEVPDREAGGVEGREGEDGRRGDRETGMREGCHGRVQRREDKGG